MIKMQVFTSKQKEIPVDNTAKGGSFKTHSAVTVVRKHQCVFKAVFFCVFFKDHFLVDNAVAVALPHILLGQSAVQSGYFWLDCIMFASLFSAKPIESRGKFPQPQYTLNRLKSPDAFSRNLTVLHFHSEKVSDTVVNRVLRLNFKAGIDNIIRATDPIFFALHHFIF